MTNRSILLLRCPDTGGIVADVAAWIASHGGNIVEADQHGDSVHGLFLQRIDFTHPKPASELRAAFATVAARWQMTWQLHEVGPRARLVILASREGHCLADLLTRCADGNLAADVVEVISNHNDLADTVTRNGVAFRHLPVGEDRSAQEKSVVEQVCAHDPDLIVLARYMRVLSPEAVEALGTHRTLNIHHSFLPAFAGARPYHQAWERGVKVIGATAHYVTADLDAGPIVAQDVAHVSHRHTPATLAREGRDLEAVVLSRAVRAHLEHRVISYGNRTVVFI